MAMTATSQPSILDPETHGCWQWYIDVDRGLNKDRMDIEMEEASQQAGASERQFAMAAGKMLAIRVFGEISL
ncbi:hypothetical protein OROMI_034927 [Orobanche minor]